MSPAKKGESALGMGLDALIRKEPADQKRAEEEWDKREREVAALKEKKIRGNKKYNAIIDFAKKYKNADSSTYHKALLELKDSIESKRFNIGLYHLDIIVKKEMRIPSKKRVKRAKIDRIDKKELPSIENEIRPKYDIIIENFAKMYKNADSIIYDEALDKLNKLFNSKGVEIRLSNLDQIIKKEIKKQDYEDLKSKLFHTKPRNLKAYIATFIEIYGESYGEHINFLKQFLREKRLSTSDKKILSVIEEVQEEIELKRFEEKLQNPDEFNVKIEDIDNFSGHEFEEFLNKLFEKMGYNAKNTSLSYDQGADLILERLGEKIVVQAKRYTVKVSNTAVQEVVASIAHYQANRGIVVTSSEFTSSAIELATTNGIELIDRFKLIELIDQYPIIRSDRTS